jgi:hypothetical protein
MANIIAALALARAPHDHDQLQAPQAQCSTSTSAPHDHDQKRARGIRRIRGSSHARAESISGGIEPSLSSKAERKQLQSSKTKREFQRGCMYTPLAIRSTHGEFNVRIAIVIR